MGQEKNPKSEAVQKWEAAKDALHAKIKEQCETAEKEVVAEEYTCETEADEGLDGKENENMSETESPKQENKDLEAMGEGLAAMGKGASILAKSGLSLATKAAKGLHSMAKDAAKKSREEMETRRMASEKEENRVAWVEAIDRQVLRKADRRLGDSLASRLIYHLEHGGELPKTEQAAGDALAAAVKARKKGDSELYAMEMVRFAYLSNPAMPDILTYIDEEIPFGLAD